MRVVLNPVPGDIGVILKVSTDQESKIVVDRTGVGLLILDAQVWEGIDDRARLDLELPCQFVNSDLTHRWRKKMDTRRWRPGHDGTLTVTRAVTTPSVMVTDSLPFS